MLTQSFLTGIFKIHNPSRWRKIILERTFAEYSLTMIDLLAWAEQNIDWIKEHGQNKAGKYTGQILAAILPYPKQSNMASALKDAVVANTGAMLASYLEKGGRETVGFPVSRDPRPIGYDNSLEEFVNVYLRNTLDTTKEETEEMENHARDRMTKRIKSNVMPINFCRSRDFNILVDVKEKRYFIFLKLTASKDPDNLQQEINSGLVDISTGEFFTRRTSVGVLFPIELGDWQWAKFLAKVMRQEASIQSGKLVKENGEYFLHVSFAFDSPESYEPEAYLGVDRGVFFSVAYAIIDRSGQPILMNHEKDGFRNERIQAGKNVQQKQKKGKAVTIRDYRGKNLESILHVLVNKMIDLALEYRAMIVLEDLNIQIKGKFYKSAWKKLHWIFEYKCKLAGVPFKKEGVWAAYTSKICIKCGEIADRSKRDGIAPVICPHCGFSGHADECASVNIARRALYRKADWGGTSKKPGDWREFHRSFKFANTAYFEAKLDLRNGR